MPNTERFWLKKQSAIREDINIMPTLKRAQVIIQTWEGDTVTSIQFEFDGVVNEYITLKGLQWLMDLDDGQIDSFIVHHKLITKYKHGHEWINCSDIMPLLGWTPSSLHATMKRP